MLLEPTTPAWALDPCPVPPLVLAGELALPPGTSCGAPRLVADVHVTRTPVTPTDRARAVALCSPAGHGVLVRLGAAWVWTGHPDLLPRRLDLTLPPQGPPWPGPRPGAGRRGLPVRVVRWTGPCDWVLLGGVPLTDPGRTLGDCARLLPERLATVCVQALAGGAVADPARVAAALRTGGPRPGRQRALRLLQDWAPPDDAPPPSVVVGRAGGAPQSWATSRCTPLVTR